MAIEKKCPACGNKNLVDLVREEKPSYIRMTVFPAEDMTKIKSGGLSITSKPVVCADCSYISFYLV